MPALTSQTGFDILMKGRKEKITFYVRDPKTDELMDVIGSATSSTFTMLDIDDDSVVTTCKFGPSGSAQILHPSNGIYQYELDSSTYKKEYMMALDCLLPSEVVTYYMFVKSVSSRQFAFAAQLGIQVDKARKSISDDIENMDSPTAQPSVKLFFGYSAAHYIYYLERGAQIINTVPPYTMFNVDTFPFRTSGTILIDAATIAALESQGIFAIDTDYNYALGGNSLVIDHFTKISSMIGMLLTKFDKDVVRFKQQFRGKGTVMFTFLPGGVRSARMLNALPGGFWSRMLSSTFA